MGLFGPFWRLLSRAVSLSDESEIARREGSSFRRENFRKFLFSKFSRKNREPLEDFLVENFRKIFEGQFLTGNWEPSELIFLGSPGSESREIFRKIYFRIFSKKFRNFRARESRNFGARNSGRGAVVRVARAPFQFFPFLIFHYYIII